MGRDMLTCHDIHMALCDGHLVTSFMVLHVHNTKLWKTSKWHSCKSWSLYDIWWMMINEQQKEWVLLNVERFIMEFRLKYIGKRIMICLHTFDDDVFVWKQLPCYCGSPSTRRVDFFNVERCILECGLIYIAKRTMICLHSFENDVFMWKELVCYCGS